MVVLLNLENCQNQLKFLSTRHFDSLFELILDNIISMKVRRCGRIKMRQKLKQTKFVCITAEAKWSVCFQFQAANKRIILSDSSIGTNKIPNNVKIF